MLKLDPQPLTCPGTYAMDFYCKYLNDDHDYMEFPHSPTNVETRAQALAVARKWGWIYHRDGTATCPKCAKQLKNKT